LGKLSLQRFELPLKILSALLGKCCCLLRRLIRLRKLIFKVLSSLHGKCGLLSHLGHFLPEFIRSYRSIVE
jgi:hypothetical protein